MSKRRMMKRRRFITVSVLVVLMITTMLNLALAKSDIKNNISVSNQFPSPSYTIKISYTVNGETVEFKIYGASYISYSEWSVYPEFGYAYYKVIDDYIISSEEYKELPPNQNLYD